MPSPSNQVIARVHAACMSIVTHVGHKLRENIIMCYYYQLRAVKLTNDAIHVFSLHILAGSTHNHTAHIKMYERTENRFVSCQTFIFIYFMAVRPLYSRRVRLCVTFCAPLCHPISRFRISFFHCVCC